MSVANVIFERDRIRLVGDTVSYRDKQPVALGSKVSILRRSHVAVTVRGPAWIGDFLERNCEDCADLEAVVTWCTAFAYICPESVLNKSCEISILGWHEGAAKAVRLGVKREAEGVRVDRIDLEPGVYLAPSLGKHDIPASLTEDQLLQVAHLQQSISVKHGLNMCVGGDVELTTITAAAIETRKIGEYPDKQITEARIAKAAAVQPIRAAA